MCDSNFTVRKFSGILHALLPRKLIIKVLFNKNGGYGFLIRLDFLIRLNVFYVIMKGVPIIRNFQRPIYQTFD